MNKSQKPSAPVRRELTPEERESQILRFVQTKRESYATSILFGLVHNPAIVEMATIRHSVKADGTEEKVVVDISAAVNASVAAADALFDKLFPGIVHAPENEQKTTK